MRVLTRRLLGLDATEDADATQARLEMAAAEPDAPPADALAAIAVLQGVEPSPASREISPAGRPYGAGTGPLTGWAGLGPNARRRRIIEGCLAALLQAAADKPLIVVLDDVHWNNSGTDEVIQRLLGALGHSRLLLLLGWRSGYRFTWAEHPALTHIALSPLVAAEARKLARSALGQRAVSDAVVAELADRTAGNPFFIEEAATILDPALVPPTVSSVISARVDALMPEEKQFIEVLATVGEPTTTRLLSIVLEHAPNSTGPELIAAELESRGLVRIDGFGESARIACRHSLLQEVVYRGLTRARRRALHARIVAAMEALAGDRVADEAAVLARHARLGEVWQAALRHARAAGSHAASHSANREAVRFYEEALEALGHLPGETEALSLGVDLRFALREPLFRLGRIEALRTRLDEAQALAETLGDPARLGQLYIFQSHHAWLAGDYPATIAAAERATALAEARNDAALKLRAVFERALGEFGQGALVASAAAMAQVAAHAEDPDLSGRFGLDAPLAVVALGYQTRALTDLGQFDAADAIAKACNARATQVSRPFTFIFAALAEGYLSLCRGAAAEAVQRLADTVTLCDRAEADLMRPVAQSFLGAAEVASGRIAEGLNWLELAVDSAAGMGLLFQQPLRLVLLSEGTLGCGPFCRGIGTGRGSHEPGSLARRRSRSSGRAPSSRTGSRLTPRHRAHLGEIGSLSKKIGLVPTFLTI